MLNIQNSIRFVLFLLIISLNANAQSVIVDAKFDASTLPAMVSSDGTINANKAADGVCSKGMIQINVASGVSQYLQADVASCSVFKVNMKSTSTTSSRGIIVKYKKGDATSYTTLSPAVPVLLAESFNLTDLYPVLVSSGSISIRLETSGGNTAIHDLYVLSSGSSAEADIKTFKLSGQVGDEVIDAAAGTVAVKVLAGTNLLNVSPLSISLSSLASISPEGNVLQDFSGGKTVNYIVTAEDGTTKNWSVIASEVSSPAKDILDFKLSDAQLGVSKINAVTGVITVLMPANLDISAIVPVNIRISTGASNPSNGIARDFNSPVIYTITAQDNSTKDWTVLVDKVDVTGFPVLDFHKVIGFAAVTADGFTGPTTGGGAIIPGRTNDTVYINGPSEFAKLCKILQDRIRYKYYSNNPLTIVLEPGIYTGAGGTETVWANSMLTVQEQSDLTIIGRKDVTLNFGINIKRSSNIIIRNISIFDYYDDGINIGETETHHVWVDHCTVGHPTTMPADPEHPDGGIDVKDGASYVTISWTKYRNSWKTGLIGHTDNEAQGLIDNGRLKVTYYANHFYNTNSRSPRVRFGEVHVLNNLEEQVMLYGIAAANSASVYAENNFFLNTRWGMYADRSVADFKAVFGNNSDNTFTSKTGNFPAKGLKQVGNEYDDSGLSVITAQINPAMLNPGGRSIKFDELNPEGIFKPSDYYDYTALSASLVRTLIPVYAGADKVDWFPKPNALPLDILSFEVKAGKGIRNQITLDWVTTNEVNTKEFIIEKRTANTSFAHIAIQASKNTSGVHKYSFIDEDISVGIFYYRLKQVDNDGKFTYSKIVSAEIKEAFAINVYPNPTLDILNVIHVAAGNAAVKILGLDGKLYFTANIKAGTNLTAVDVSKLYSGTYLVVFDNEGKKSVSKFIKK